MIAIDTNIFLRLALQETNSAEDRQMAATGSHMLRTGGVFVSVTVAIESYWFLRRKMKLVRGDIVRRFREALATDAFVFEQPERILSALNATEHGIEFDDALHAFATPPDLRFATFDAQLAQRWARLKSPLTVFVPELLESPSV
jgi:predicted nucleic-acid-binding protein